MQSFPRVHDLARATEEQVNAHWAGLGFYRRARLLHQGAQYLVETYNGTFPESVKSLLTIPGVGPYTAGAIASIAFDVCTPVVDGNVCRVLSRLRGVANHIKAPIFKDKLAWNLAEQIVNAGDGSCAGDVNQALMELGATYCAPSGSGTDENDPLRDFYLSTKLGLQYYHSTRAETSLERVDALVTTPKESTCELCDATGITTVLEQLSGAMDDQVANADNKEEAAKRCGHSVFPTSPPKLSKREEVLAVGAISSVSGKHDKDTYWLLVRRPKKGLLAGQWEFPSVCVWNSSDNTTTGINRNTSNTTGGAKARAGDKRKSPSTPSLPSKQKGTQPMEVPAISVPVRRKALSGLLEELLPPRSADSLKLENLNASPMEHIFSHVRHTMWIDYASLLMTGAKPDKKGWTTPNGKEVRWMRESDMQELGITSGVKKILKAVKEEQAKNSKKQNFFQPKKKRK
jgi:A/G-specific adenine glycosylase